MSHILNVAAALASIAAIMNEYDVDAQTAFGREYDRQRRSIMIDEGADEVCVDKLLLVEPTTLVYYTDGDDLDASDGSIIPDPDAEDLHEDNVGLRGEDDEDDSDDEEESDTEFN